MIKCTIMKSVSIDDVHCIQTGEQLGRFRARVCRNSCEHPANLFCSSEYVRVCRKSKSCEHSGDTLVDHAGLHCLDDCFSIGDPALGLGIQRRFSRLCNFDLLAGARLFCLLDFGSVPGLNASCDASSRPAIDLENARGACLQDGLASSSACRASVALLEGCILHLFRVGLGWPQCQLLPRDFPRVSGLGV